MPNIIDGKKYAAEILEKLAAKALLLRAEHNIIPAIAIILIGNDQASLIYVNNKIKAAEKIGIRAMLIALPTDISNSELLTIIFQLNHNKDISAIIMQLPIPKHLDKEMMLEAIIANKDVDGFNPSNIGRLHANIKDGYVPGTALGCLYLIEKCESNLSGKNVVIVGRSNIVGKPLSALLLNKNCTVTICHSETRNLSSITANADIVVTAIGKPSYFTSEYFKPDSIVIDVGMNRNANNKITGDVDFFSVCDMVRYITPVPGGVGPMTVAFLLSNTLQACYNQNQLKLDE